MFRPLIPRRAMDALDQRKSFQLSSMKSEARYPKRRRDSRMRLGPSPRSDMRRNVSRLTPRIFAASAGVMILSPGFSRTGGSGSEGWQVMSASGT